MSWIQTYTGRKFFPLAPRAADVNIRDIAHSLSLQCRFNGHCLAFYSVAEHSVRVSRHLDAAHALWGLLHDAAEAYVSDIPRPLKRQWPFFEEAEDRVLRVIIEQHDLPWPMPPEVRRADDVLLSTECRDLLGPAPEPWTIDVPPLAEKITPVDPARAEAMFLRRYRELTGA